MATPLPEDPRLEHAPDAPTARRAPQRGFLASFVYASDGLLRTLSTQRNMKIHWVSGLAVMLVGMALELTLAARASVLFCVFGVLSMEVLNTSLEAFVDLHVKQYARQAMVAKDAAAAAVLVWSLGAAVVFADVLFHRFGLLARSIPAIIRTVTFGVPLLGTMVAVLWLRRSVIRLTLLGALGVALLGVLAWHSRDEVFSACALALLVGGLVARFREPELVG